MLYDLFGNFSISYQFFTGSATFNGINCTASLKSRAYCRPSAGRESFTIPKS